MKLTNDDIRHLKVWMEISNSHDLYWGFTCLSRQNYTNEVRKEGEDEILYGIYNQDRGTLAEIRITWDKVRVHVCIPAEAFPLMISPTHEKVMERLLELGDVFTPEAFSEVLKEMGFEDNSDIELIK